MAVRKRLLSAPFEIHATTLVHPDKLNPAPYNPRRIKPAMLRSLKQSIVANGFLDPLIVQKKGMVIIGGHQRLRAMREICAEADRPMPEIPCIVIDVDNRKARKLNIALNRVGGEFDTTLLGTLLKDLEHETKLSDEDLVSMGLTQEEVIDFLKLVETEPVVVDESVPFARSATLSLAFDDVKKRDTLKKRIDELAKAESKRTGDVIYDRVITR
jgi:ParB-like chromosome segregation protein Spo0J